MVRMTRTPHRYPLGKRPAQPARPHLSFSVVFAEARRLTDKTPPPASVVFAAEAISWGMLGNDQYGDCVEAGLAHLVEQLTWYGSGTELRFVDTDALGWYSAITGFKPSVPSSDQGTYTQDALAYARKTGLNGHKVTAYAVLDHKNTTEVKQGIAAFGNLVVGLEFPDSAMDQFNNGDGWTVVKGAQIEGGHCVLAVGYDAAGVWAVTWGAVVHMTWAFWTKYVDEAWVVLDADGIKDAAGFFTGLASFYAVGAVFAALTGETNPVPQPTPVDPGPGPVVPPVGGYDVNALAGDLRALLAAHKL